MSDKPLIGITCSFERSETGRDRNVLNAAYADAVYRAGGLPFPIALPPEPDHALIAALLARCPAIVFTGGWDVQPARYGQPPHPRTEVMHPRRDAVEFALMDAARAQRKPMLSICLGCQVANVACGGALVQHIDDLPLDVRIVHEGAAGKSAHHPARIAPGSRLAEILGVAELEVNSRHHQALSSERIGEGLRPVAWAPDGVIEAVEATDDRFLIAVQWHPEDLTDRREHLRLFEALVAEARRASGSDHPPARP